MYFVSSCVSYCFVCYVEGQCVIFDLVFGDRTLVRFIFCVNVIVWVSGVMMVEVGVRC